jgi:hypothetical protein
LPPFETGALPAKKKQKAVLGRLFCGRLSIDNFYVVGLGSKNASETWRLLSLAKLMRKSHAMGSWPRRSV